MLTQDASLLLYGKPLVRPGNIESELEKIRSAAAQQDAEKEQAVSGTASPRGRATLCNLVILNGAPQTKGVDSTIDELIDALCVEYPSRFFIMDAQLPPGEAAKHNGVATAVSSRCFLTNSGAHVCSEEVYMSASTEAIPLIKNLLMSLLAPDVDVVLLVLGAEASASLEALLSTLTPIADRIVYDSMSFRGYAQKISLLSGVPLKAASDHPLGEAVEKLSDVNWKRTRRWRALISEGFDAEPLADGSLRMKKVALSCASGVGDILKGDVPADALLLSGWILSSLGAKLSGGAATRTKTGLLLNCDGGGEKFQLEFCEESDPDWTFTDASLRSVELLAETLSASARLRIDRRLSRGTAEISIGITDSGKGGGGNNEFTVRNSPYTSAPLRELVLSHITSRRDDAHYFRAVELSVNIARAAAGAKSK